MKLAAGVHMGEASSGKLHKVLRPRHITMISLGGIVGAGLFVGSSAAIATAGPAAIVSYALAGAIVFVVMQMLGELAATQPEIESFTEYTRRPLGGFAAFATGWLYAYFWIIVVAVETLIGAQMLAPMIGAPQWAIALFLLVSLAGVNLFSVGAYAEFEFWFASIKIVAVILFILAGVAWLTGVGWQAGAPITGLLSYENFMPHGPLSLLAGVPAVIFSMCGAEIAAIAAAESPEPSRSVSRIARAVIARVLIFYLGSVLVIVSIVPWAELVPGQSPFVATLDRMGVPYAAPAMAAIIFTAVMSCLNSGIYVASRILLGLARKGDAPSGLAKLNHRGVPSAAVMLSAAIAFAIMTLSSASYQGVFTFLLNASGAVMLVVYLMIALAQFRNRRQLEAGGGEFPIRMRMFPWLNVTAMAAIVAILVAMIFIEQMRSQIVATASTIAIVGIAYAANRFLARSREQRSNEPQKA